MSKKISSHMLLLLVSFVVVMLSFGAEPVYAGGHRYPEDFSCSLCVDFIEEVLRTRREDPLEFCSRLDVCEYLKQNMLMLPEFMSSMDVYSLPAAQTCIALKMCPLELNEATTPHEWQLEQERLDSISFLGPNVNQTNFRVTKAFGPYGYNYVRFSVIDEVNTPRSEAFLNFFRDTGYSAPFQYRWTNKVLYSKLVYINPLAGTIINLGPDFIVRVGLPYINSPVRGIIVADPCIGSTWVWCVLGDRYKVLDRLSQALNIAAEEPAGLSFWMILGDMFYDRTSTYSDEFFKRLSTRVRATAFTSTLGNHDIWVRGHPLLKVRADQFGNGFMQYYAQDTVAAYNMTVNVHEPPPLSIPFNFTVDPDKEFTVLHEYRELPAVENFIFYHLIGNIGVFGFSGAHPWDVTMPYAKLACTYFQQNSPQVVLLLNHWDGINDGAQDLTGSIMRNKFLNVSGCELRMPIHYVVGHTHCNQVLENGNGFLVGGQGMDGCSQFGIPIIETTIDHRLEVLYYPLETKDGPRDDVWNCITMYGFAGCKAKADLWYNQTLTTDTSSE